MLTGLWRESFLRAAEEVILSGTRNREHDAIYLVCLFPFLFALLSVAITVPFMAFGLCAVFLPFSSFGYMLTEVRRTINGNYRKY